MTTLDEVLEALYSYRSKLRMGSEERAGLCVAEALIDKLKYIDPAPEKEEA
jgi:hypothetical protein